MAQKVLFTFNLLLLFLAFSFLISSTAVIPTTTILKPTFDHPSAQDFVFQDARDLKISGGDSFQRMFEERMVLENNDYPGTGANNHHDPNSPASKP